MLLPLPIDTESLIFNEPVPFCLRVDRELLGITRQKLALARYPEEQSDFGEDNWAQGAKVAVVRELAEYWLNSYDWERKEVSRKMRSADWAMTAAFPASTQREELTLAERIK
jgi:hypothetical protein